MASGLPRRTRLDRLAGGRQTCRSMSRGPISLLLTVIAVAGCATREGGGSHPLPTPVPVTHVQELHIAFVHGVESDSSSRLSAGGGFADLESYLLAALPAR